MPAPFLMTSTSTTLPRTPDAEAHLDPLARARSAVDALVREWAARYGEAVCDVTVQAAPGTG
ncbi:MAG: hypothetical protein DYG90_12660, partial [Chloroflexi bacterium CFX6]|nr:hypothetical protein [Chloroflexi bacterium CFX6]